MRNFVRLQLVAKVTYYFGWIALVCGGLVHFRVAESLFDAMHLTKRNLFEASVVCFLICMASELRALDVCDFGCGRFGQGRNIGNEATFAPGSIGRDNEGGNPAWRGGNDRFGRVAA